MTFQATGGEAGIPRAHQYLPITAVERDLWLGWMDEALAHLDYSQELRHYYLQEQLRTSGEVIRRTCEPE